MIARIGKTIDQLAVGDSAYFAKTLSEADMLLFAGITGDVNQLPINEEFAKRTKYGRRIAHGMLTASFITNIVGMQLPGYGSSMQSQKVRFLKPVFVGDTIEIGVTITAIHPEENTVDFETNAINQNGETVMVGSGVINPPVPLGD
ncbi:MAG: MaoC family dehydratase [Spirochaetaceae bacterium]|mgnify:CR=1 FL=1|nr:MAG: MaoC family dehydratase [Spirochaetaceae bacterium]